jgi:tellurite resistance protein TehA-like permease
MRIRSEILIFARVLRIAISSPVNLIVLALVVDMSAMIAMSPKPSLVYMGDKPREAFVAITILSLAFFGLYLLVRLAVAIFRKRRKALLFACGLWALLIPIVIGVITNHRYGYRDDDAKHALAAMIYDRELK